MRPEHGARFTLRLTHSTPAVAYRFEAELPDGTLVGTATVEPSDGAVHVDAPQSLPGWLENTVVGLLRSLWRVRRDPHDSPPWPRRLTRWRRGGGAAAE